ncbi:MAG: hypothetical protein ACXAEU_03310 [Candidatus Hodarchaeales archaeon]
MREDESFQIEVFHIYRMIVDILPQLKQGDSFRKLPVYGLSTLNSRVLPTSGEVPAPCPKWTGLSANFT